MANGRVQVQGVGSAPKLQAVVNAGGQYRVQTQQAGENKLQKLAGALSQINPILKDYAAIQEIEYEMYKDELNRLSPEDAKKKLSQSEQTLDKEARKGNIPFFGSPLNWKRKKRAQGALLHNAFQQALDDRLRDPLPGDEGESTDAIIASVRGEFESQYEALQSDVFVKEGFQESINPTLHKYALAYDAQKDATAKAQISDGVASDMFNAAPDIIDSAQTVERFNDIWSATGAFTPKEQLAIIKKVAVDLATTGDDASALNFVEFASKHLKVGNHTMASKAGKGDDATFGRYTDQEAVLKEQIRTIRKRQGDKLEDDAKVELRSILAEVNEVGYAASQELDKGNTYKIGNVTITNKDDLRDYFREKVLESDNTYVRASGFAEVNKAIAGLELAKTDQVITFLNAYNNYSAVNPIKARLANTWLSLGHESGFTPDEDGLPIIPQDLIPGHRAILNDTIREYRTMLEGVAQLPDVPQNEMLKDAQGREDVLVDKFKTRVSDLLKNREKLLTIRDEAGKRGELIDDESFSDETASWINPSELVEDKTATFGDNFYDIEKGLRTKDIELANEANDDFEDDAKETYGIVNDPKATPEEKRVAKRKLIMWSLGTYAAGEKTWRFPLTGIGEQFLKGEFETSEIMSVVQPKGGGDTIEKGFRKKIDISDMKDDIKALASFYPLIGKNTVDRMLAQTDGEVDVTVVADLIEKLTGGKPGTADVTEFLKHQQELYDLFKATEEKE